MIARVLEDTQTQLPSLVYVPGIDGTGEFLLGTRASLEQRFRLIRLSYRSGERDGGAERELVGDGYEDLAGSLADCLASCGVESTLLLAESFGVALALRTALDHPQLVRGLMLVNGFCYYERRWRLALSSRVLSALPAPLFRLGRRYIAPSALIGPRHDVAAKRAFIELTERVFDSGYRRRMKMIARVDLRSRLSEIRQPVVIYASDRDRIVPSVRSGRLMQAGLENATLEILSNAGHVVLALADEPWSDRLDAFNADCPQAVRTLRGA